MGKKLAALASMILLTCVAAGLASSSASAAEQPAGLKRYEKAQASRSFVVYAPTTTFDLAQSTFQSVPCGGTSGKGISVDYGSQGSGASKWIGLQESPGNGCLDGPDGIARTPVATFSVNGAKVSLAGRCADVQQSVCKKSSAALFEKSGYTTVTLPGSEAHPTPTYIEIYSQEMSVAEIRTFIRGLVPAT